MVPVSVHDSRQWLSDYGIPKPGKWQWITGPVSIYLTSDAFCFQMYFRGLLQKKGRFKAYLPVGTFPRGCYILVENNIMKII